MKISAKQFKNGCIQTETFTLTKYLEILEEYEQSKKPKSLSHPAYCHDIPIFSLIPELIKDVPSFPLTYFQNGILKSGGAIANSLLAHLIA